MALVVVVAGQLRARFSMNESLVWITVQSLATVAPPLAAASSISQLIGAVVVGLAYLAFQLFALGAASLAESEKDAREELAAAHAEAGDFAAMARILLGDEAHARKVQLRFNQMGLKVRQLKEQLS